jgi:hypothetical protein
MRSQLLRHFIPDSTTYLKFRTAKDPPTLPPIVAITTIKRMPKRIQKFLFRSPRIVLSCVGAGVGDIGGAPLGGSSQYL